MPLFESAQTAAVRSLSARPEGILVDPTGALGAQSQPPLDISTWPGHSAYFRELWIEAAQYAYGDVGAGASPQDRERARMALRYLCRQAGGRRGTEAA